MQSHELRNGLLKPDSRAAEPARALLHTLAGCFRLRLCKRAGTALKSALLRKICQRLVNQWTWNLRRSAIFALVLSVKPALKPFTQPRPKSGLARWLCKLFDLVPISVNHIRPYYE